MLKIIFLVCTFGLVIPFGAMAGSNKCCSTLCCHEDSQRHDWYNNGELHHHKNKGSTKTCIGGTKCDIHAG